MRRAATEPRRLPHRPLVLCSDRVRQGIFTLASVHRGGFTELLELGPKATSPPDLEKALLCHRTGRSCHLLFSYLCRYHQPKSFFFPHPPIQSTGNLLALRVSPATTFTAAALVWVAIPPSWTNDEASWLPARCSGSFTSLSRTRPSSQPMEIHIRSGHPVSLEGPLRDTRAALAFEEKCTNSHFRTVRTADEMQLSVFCAPKKVTG